MENPTDPGQATRERIVHATLKIMEREGYQAVTVRRIAEEAKVNLAAVNYHFGSKDQAIRSAMNYLLADFQGAYEVLKDTAQSPGVRIEQFLNRYAENALRYPGLIQYFVLHADQTLSPLDDYVGFIKREGMILLVACLREIFPLETDRQLVMRILHLVSAMSMPILVGQGLGKVTGFDFMDESDRRAYFHLLVETYVGDGGTASI